MATKYTVNRMQERSRMNDQGHIERYYHIEAVTAGGIPFTLDLPEGQSDPETAKKLLAEKAERLDKIKAG